MLSSEDPASTSSESCPENGSGVPGQRRRFCNESLLTRFVNKSKFDSRDHEPRAAR
jgi:hypothetical protein